MFVMAHVFLFTFILCMHKTLSNPHMARSVGSETLNSLSRQERAEASFVHRPVDFPRIFPFDRSARGQD